jgi:hypothetical protein
MIRTFIICEFIGNLDAKRKARLNCLDDFEDSRTHFFLKIKSLFSEKKISWAGLLGSLLRRKTLDAKSPIVSNQTLKGG